MRTAQLPRQPLLRTPRYRRASRYCARRYNALVGCTGRGLPLLQHTPGAIAALLVVVLVY